MRNLARKQQSHESEVVQGLGTVQRAMDGAFVVELETREVLARRAKSCLLQPVPGDLVLVATVNHDEAAYVLAVLDREEGAPQSIVADGDLEIHLPRGALAITATEGVELTSAKEVSVVSGAVSVRAVDGNVAFERFSFLSKLLRADTGKAKIFAETLDSVLERLSQRVKRSYRTVEECDHLRAESIDYAAKGTMSLHGKNALVTAQNLAKVEGDQIHLG